MLNTQTLQEMYKYILERINMISVADAKRIRKQLKLTHLVLLGKTKNSRQHVATSGETKVHAQEAAVMGNDLKLALSWPKQLCESKPLERVCNNCAFFRVDEPDIKWFGGDKEWFIDYKFIGRASEGFTAKDFEAYKREHEIPVSGACCIEPQKVERDGDDPACNRFEPDC